MDINFHYFAVKRIARVAGFEEEEAQLIAEYSQFVDEYTDDHSYYINEVPEYAEILLNESGQFQAVQTGFVSNLDYAALIRRENQINYLIPFHFMPHVASESREKVKETYQVKRSVKGDHSIISDMLEEEAATCRRYLSGTKERRQSLISLGVLLHVFADTYAHENFNGFAGDINAAKLLEAVTDMGEDVIKQMEPSSVLPPIGHGRVGLAPDATCVHFKIEQEEPIGKTKIKWERSNWKDFMECSMEILKFLTGACYGCGPDAAQIENMTEALSEGFAVRPKDFTDPDLKELKVCWENTAASLPPTEFHYDKKEIWKRMLPVPVRLEELGMSKEEYYHIYSCEEQKGLLDEILQKPCQVEEDFFMYNCTTYAVRKMTRMILPE